MSTTRRTTRTQSERREQTRAQLIDATIASLAENGYQATTVRAVAARADSSLGALSHHFASRLDLIAATLDEVGQLGADELRRVVADLPVNGSGNTDRLLDVVWSFFHGELFTVWLKVWIAAADDPLLHDRLAPIDRRLNDTLSEIVAAARPSGVPPRVWVHRLTVAMDTLRGLALRLDVEPRETAPRIDPWPATRSELAAMISRTG